MASLFWISALSIAYVYVGYPMLLMAWARVRPARRLDVGADTGPLPRVSVVIAARNEAARLPARIDNLLALDYPADRREIIVVSDGSTDATLDVLGGYGEVVRTIAAPPRGKAAALNLAVAHAGGDVLVFADARQMFAPDALRALVAPLADARVGGVTGELLLDCEASEVAGRRSGGERRTAANRRLRAGRATDRRATTDRRGGA